MHVQILQWWLDNIKRIIPNEFCAEIKLNKVRTLKIFKWLKNKGIN